MLEVSILINLKKTLLRVAAEGGMQEILKKIQAFFNFQVEI